MVVQNRKVYADDDDAVDVLRPSAVVLLCCVVSG